MIDFTEIQLEAVPPEIANLQQSNASLNDNNKMLKGIVGVLIIGGILVFGYRLYKLSNEDKRMPRDYPD